MTHDDTPTGEVPPVTVNTSTTPPDNPLSHAQRVRVAALHEARDIMTSRHMFGSTQLYPWHVTEVAAYIVDGSMVDYDTVADEDDE